MHLQSGTLLQGGKYRIVRFIKSGGFGCTYEALLFAPDSGERTRDRLRSKAADATGMAREKILEGLDALEAALEDK